MSAEPTRLFDVPAEEAADEELVRRSMRLRDLFAAQLFHGAKAADLPMVYEAVVAQYVSGAMLSVALAGFRQQVASDEKTLPIDPRRVRRI